MNEWKPTSELRWFNCKPKEGDPKGGPQWIVFEPVLQQRWCLEGPIFEYEWRDIPEVTER